MKTAEIKYNLIESTSDLNLKIKMGLIFQPKHKFQNLTTKGLQYLLKHSHKIVRIHIYVKSLKTKFCVCQQNCTIFSISTVSLE